MNAMLDAGQVNGVDTIVAKSPYIKGYIQVPRR